MNSKLLLVFFCTIFLTIFYGNRVYALGSLKEKPCTTVGPICSDDCSQLLLCALEGQNPMFVQTCNKGTDGQQRYCVDSNGPAACAVAQEPTCNGGGGGGGQDPVRCAEFGEFPNPIKCDLTIKCLEDSNHQLNIMPVDGRTCNPGEFINVLKPGLPCEKGTTCPRQPVTCSKPGVGGLIQSDSVYCYTCGKEDSSNINTIFVHYCKSKKNHRFWRIISGHNDS